MNKSTEKYWLESVKFHGHECPGLAIGLKSALIAKEILAIVDNSGDEEIVCLAETDACGIDAIQVTLGATVGSGSLRIIYKGKQAFSFYNRQNNKSVRVVFKGIDGEMQKHEKIQEILNSENSKYFHIKTTKYPFPPRAAIYKSALCSECFEITAENAIEYVDGEPLCGDCYEEKILPDNSPKLKQLFNTNK